MMNELPFFKAAFVYLTLKLYTLKLVSESGITTKDNSSFKCILLKKYIDSHFIVSKGSFIVCILI